MVCTRPVETMRKRKFKKRKKEITSGHGILPGGAKRTGDWEVALILLLTDLGHEFARNRLEHIGPVAAPGEAARAAQKDIAARRPLQRPCYTCRPLPGLRVPGDLSAARFQY